MKRIKLILLFIIFFLPFNVLAITLPKLNSNNIIVYDDANKEILYEKNASEVVNIASLTKIMTTIVAIENIKDLNETVEITNSMLQEVPWDASIAGLKEGDVVTYRDLLYATMLPSGADAATALAHSISGNTNSFVNLMNQKAKELDLNDTHFVNVTGLDADGHYSSANDVLKYLLYALQNDLFKEIYETRSYTLSNGLLVLSTISKYADKGYDLSKIVGSKTGFEEKAGLCMSAIININGKELILLTLGAPKDPERTNHIKDTLEVINYLSNKYKEQILYQKDSLLFSLPVKNSNIDNYDVYVEQNISVFTDDVDTIDYKYEYDGLKELDFNNKKGDKIGTITYYYDGKKTTQDVFLSEDINISFIKIIKENYLYIIPLVILFLFIIFIFIIKHKKRKKKKNKKH